MKRFVFLAYGEMDRTPQAQQTHQLWWASLQGHVVDTGRPLMDMWACRAMPM